MLSPIRFPLLLLPCPSLHPLCPRLKTNYEELREKYVAQNEELYRKEYGERHRSSTAGAVPGMSKYEEIVGPVIEEYERHTNELVEEKEEELTQLSERKVATELYVEELRARVAKLTECEASTEFNELRSSMQNGHGRTESMSTSEPDESLELLNKLQHVKDEKDAIQLEKNKQESAVCVLQVQLAQVPPPSPSPVRPVAERTMSYGRLNGLSLAKLPPPISPSSVPPPPAPRVASSFSNDNGFPSASSSTLISESSSRDSQLDSP
ncbi:hypothetical protein EW146_g4210, partial [Bondarzewia mesenterica]